MSNKPHPSLLVRLPNWVGDVVMALPAVQAMQQLGIELHLLGKPWIIDLLGAMNLPLLPLGQTFWQTKKTLTTLSGVDKALLFTNSFSSAALTRLAGFSTIGYQTDKRRLLLSAGIDKSPAKHEVEYFWDIARFACDYWFSQRQWPESIPQKIHLPISSEALAKANTCLAQHRINKPFWVLCPFATGRGKQGESKIWPHWSELSKQLSDYTLVVCPGKQEEQWCETLVPNATVLPGLSLSAYAAILMQSEQVIANDSGPMHLASAVGAKTLGLFGVSDPNRTSPWHSNYMGKPGAWPTLEQVLGKIKEGVQ